MAVALGVVVHAVRVIRRIVPETREGFHAEISAPMLGVVAALFGLLFAFVVIIAYENFLEANADVSREADSLASIVRDSGAFSEPDGDRVRGAVETYARAVVDDEWTLMRDGSDSTRASRALDEVFVALQSVEPSSPGATGFFDDSVRQLNDALDARRDRLDAADGGLPFEMVGLILFSSFVIVGYAVLVGSPDFWFHVLGPAAIAIEDQGPGRESVLTPPLRRHQALVGAVAHAAGYPLGQRVIVWWRPSAVLLEPSVSVAHGGLGIHCQSVALPRPAPLPVSRRWGAGRAARPARTMRLMRPR